MAQARKSKSGKIRPEIAEKRLKALNLRKAGASFDTIAQACGYASPASAYKAVRTAIADTLREPAEEVLTLELERLDRLMVAWWARATGTNGNPDGEATDRVLKIIRQRCDLMGLNIVAVKRLDSPGESGGSISDDLAAKVLEAAHRELKRGNQE